MEPIQTDRYERILITLVLVSAIVSIGASLQLLVTSSLLSLAF